MADLWLGPTARQTAVGPVAGNQSLISPYFASFFLGIGIVGWCWFATGSLFL